MDQPPLERFDHNPFLGRGFPIFVLPLATSIYHGSDSISWNPIQEDIFLPAWFSLDRQTADDYSLMERSLEAGAPYVLEYVTTRPLHLLDLSSPKAQEILDRRYQDHTTGEMAAWVLETGVDGWFIEGVEIMLGVHDFALF